MRVALYARVSTRDKDQTPENQLIRLRDYCRLRGWDAVEYVDYASGADSNRPELNKLMHDLPTLNGVIVLRVDRFGRSVPDFTLKLQAMHDRGVWFEAMDQGLKISSDKSDATANLLLNMLVAVAEFERDIIRYRINDGISRARREGKRLGRPRIMELRDVSDEKIFELRRQGHSIREISQIVGIGRGTVHNVLSKNPPPSQGA